MIPSFATERLNLRPLTVQDAEFIIELVNTPGWLRFIGDRKIYTRADAERYLQNGPLKSYAQHQYGLLLVELKENGTAIGMCGLIKRDWLRFADIGFAFLPAYEGKGYGLESSAAVLQDARERLSLSHVGGITVPENTASIKLLEKLGLAYEKTVQLPDDTESLLLYQREL